ncbi:MAG: hypothetical protein HPY73_06510 [Methanomassiliicoccales archaeon]|nr:MAG: hypothetical protein HPY73_06510 [Methanomassiliicoccales archaeon]
MEGAALKAHIISAFPIVLMLFLVVSAIYALSSANVYWLMVALLALTISLLPLQRGEGVFGAWNLWVPALVSGPYLLGIAAEMFGFEPFDLKSPIFWVIGSISLFSLSLMTIDALRYTKVRLNTSFTVIFTFVFYVALLALQGPMDYYLNGRIGRSYFEDNIVMMSYLIVCTTIGIALIIVIRSRLGLTMLLRMPEKGRWELVDGRNLRVTLFFTVLLTSLMFFSYSNGNRYSLGTGVVSVLLLWVPQGLDMRGLIRLPNVVIIIIGVSLILNSFGVASGLYDNSYWWDKITHIISGFAVGMIAAIALLLLQGMGKIYFPHYWFIFFLFIIVLFFEGIWEIIEFTLDHTIGTSMQYGRLDTVNDLMSDSIAGLIVGAAVAYYTKESQNDDFIRKMKAERITQIFDDSM